ncbi:hypothetical protein KTE23_11255 [Burkholderia multivorans]|uniref:hypothetical protein n=1 Tax=Burkholderia multivorans TaxID=87883 RepID=UPI001C226DD4|nr:hypothetical protein [Burkholderia multivorans]MBU9417148.1 hypothetical protein [Burkholderia multivorans]
MGAPDDLDAMAAHLTAFQRTIDQMSTGTRVDVGDLIQPDQMRLADALTAMIDHMESARQDLLADAGNSAERGSVAQLRAQLSDLESAPRPTLADVVESMQPRRTYEVTKTRAARERAQIERDAPVELQSRLDAQDAQIARLRGAIETNRNAELARAALPAVDQHIAALRRQRDALEAPPSRRASTIANAARDVVMEPVPREPVPTAVSEPSAESSAPVARTESTQGTFAAPAADGLPDYTPEFHAENANRPVSVVEDGPNGETRLSSLGEQMALVNAELARQNEIIPLFRIAAQCFLANGE